MAGNSDDTNFFWQSKYGTETWMGTENLVDVTDSYANNLKYRIGFYHVPSGKMVYFKAFITKYREDFVSDWKEEPIFGRTDGIYTYSSTKRKISLSFDVPAASESEAYENMGRIQRLIQFQYPSYDETGPSIGAGGEHHQERVIGQSPLVRISVMNLLQRPPVGKKMKNGSDERTKKSRRDLLNGYTREDQTAAAGILAAINSLSLDTDVGKHAIFEKAPGTVLPQFFSVSLDFFVIHEDTLGFDQQGNSLLPNYPWDVWLKEPSDAEVQAAEQSTAARTEMLLNNQAAEDIAKARYRGLGRRKRALRDYKKYGKESHQEGTFATEMKMEAEKYLDEND